MFLILLLLFTQGAFDAKTHQQGLQNASSQHSSAAGDTDEKAVQEKCTISWAVASLHGKKKKRRKDFWEGRILHCFFRCATSCILFGKLLYKNSKIHFKLFVASLFSCLFLHRTPSCNQSTVYTCTAWTFISDDIQFHFLSFALSVFVFLDFSPTLFGLFIGLLSFFFFATWNLSVSHWTSNRFYPSPPMFWNTIFSNTLIHLYS